MKVVRASVCRRQKPPSGTNLLAIHSIRRTSGLFIHRHRPDWLGDMLSNDGEHNKTHHSVNRAFRDMIDRRSRHHHRHHA